MNVNQMWVLRAETGAAGRLTTFRIPVGEARTFGRAPAADFTLDAALVSRVHCRVSGGPERLVVEDLDSTNGTWVNDARVDRALLVAGDRLRIGRLELTVSREGARKP